MARPKVALATLMRTRLAVYERDGFQCRHCGWAPPHIPADYDGRYVLADEKHVNAKGKPGVRTLDLDHVYPFALGGNFTVDNLQSLCSSCNARKGADVE